MAKPIIALTPGEPAGIGPDITLQLLAAKQQQNAEFIVLADPQLLENRAERLSLKVSIKTVSLKQLNKQPLSEHSSAPTIHVLPVEGYTACEPAKPDAKNACYILNSLSLATELCTKKVCKALVTGPVNKHLINQGLNKDPAANSVFFSGHTEFLADLTGTDTVVMMLAGHSPNSKNNTLRIALTTTHLPLSQVSQAITAQRLETILQILHNELTQRFNIARPKILVCGLNPHAGEQGDLGTEEQSIINPVINKLNNTGFDLSEALPADTLFTPHYLATADAVLAMYHDQGLPVLKSHCFGQAANITLGLPIIRTSVDHGTAFELAGSGKADTGSLETAIRCAIEMTSNAH